jgi:hypothetical protein
MQCPPVHITLFEQEVARCKPVEDRPPTNGKRCGKPLDTRTRICLGLAVERTVCTEELMTSDGSCLQHLIEVTRHSRALRTAVIEFTSRCIGRTQSHVNYRSVRVCASVLHGEHVFNPDKLPRCIRVLYITGVHGRWVEENSFFNKLPVLISRLNGLSLSN